MISSNWSRRNTSCADAYADARKLAGAVAVVGTEDRPDSDPDADKAPKNPLAPAAGAPATGLAKVALAPKHPNDVVEVLAATGAVEVIGLTEA